MGGWWVRIEKIKVGEISPEKIKQEAKQQKIRYEKIRGSIQGHPDNPINQSPRARALHRQQPRGLSISLSGPCSLGVAEVRTSHPRRGEAGPGSAPGALAKQS